MTRTTSKSRPMEKQSCGRCIECSMVTLRSVSESSNQCAGTSWSQKQVPGGGGDGAEEQKAAGEIQEVDTARGSSRSADHSPLPQERAAGSAQAATHEVPKWL